MVSIDEILNPISVGAEGFSLELKLVNFMFQATWVYNETFKVVTAVERRYSLMASPSFI